MEPELLYLAALQSVPGLGIHRLRTLLNTFPTAQAVWQAPVAALRTCKLPASVIENLQKHRQQWSAEDLLKKLKTYNTRLLSIHDPAYPDLLKATASPPYILYYQGVLPPPHTLSIAVVGARKATPYGGNIAQTLCRTWAQNGIVIISGGARGIDTRAHRGALSGKGKTFVVVASGLDITYPRENKKLFEEIATNGGGIISEYPFGVPPQAPNFPARNRLLAGLSHGTVVVEAAARSGSLITADFALEEGRDVFTVPGSIYSQMSRGSNALLRNGAIPLTCAEDLLEEYHRTAPVAAPTRPFTLSLEEETLLHAISYETPVSSEDLLVKTGLPVTRLTALLLQLQLHQLIETWNGTQYIRKAGT